MNSPSGSAETARAAAIVPAYNEEGTVGGVVRALKAARGIDEVIVVDDGSSDHTSEEARAAGADQVLRLEENVGKGGALRRGVRATSAEVLFFCDADFIGFTPAHAERLLQPVREGRLAMCAGERDRGPVLARIISRLPHISGERALRREIFEGVPPRFLRRFRVEIALEYFCAVNKLAVEAVPTRGIAHVRKMQKRGVIGGLLAYAAMIVEIIEAFIQVRFSKKEFRQPHAS